jgi:Tfp pilus assembly protein PilE
VVVIIGILAAIAIPKFANTKEKAYLSAMKSDLRNLAAAEEAYFADWLTYTPSTTDPNMDYNASQGVTVFPGVATGTGWNATASHSGTAKTCGLYYGDAPAAGPSTLEGVVECEK